MKSYFRYGYDPWMIGMTIVILIAEALGFFLGGESSYDPFAHLPFWLLTLYVVSMIAMFLTACFITNDALQNDDRFYKSPVMLVAVALLIFGILLGAIFEACLPSASLFVAMLIPISLGVMAVARKNWISLVFEILFLASQMLVLIYVLI